METRDYLTEEQLERRVSDSRAAIRYIKGKMLIQQGSVTVLLSYFLLEFKFPGMALIVLTSFNCVGWLMWMYTAVNPAFRRWSVEHSSMDSRDEYRRLSYYLARLTALEALLDMLFGLQFVLLICWVFLRGFLIR